MTILKRHLQRLDLPICVVLLITACTSTAAQPGQTPTPEVFIALTQAVPLPQTQRSVAGTVRWGTTPVPGARVEMRMGDWASNSEGAISSAIAGADGRFLLEDPPAGEYGLVAGWPDFGANVAPVTPVQVGENTALNDVDVYLAKELQLLEPVSGSTVRATPTLRWTGLTEVAAYQLWIIDAETTEMVFDLVITATASAPTVIAPPLTPGRTYRWIVNGLERSDGGAAADNLLASLTSEFTVQAAGASGPPAYWPTAGWRSTTPEEQGMDAAALAAVFDWIEGTGLNLNSLLIVRNGYLVTEAYFQPYTADTRMQVQSVTKSVIGMLTGIAIQQGAISGVDQRVLNAFPGRYVANRDPRKEVMTVEHLLTLTAGLACADAPGASGTTVAQARHWVQYTLEQPMVSAPGEQFNYCSAAVHLLSAILQEATGRNARELANAELFAPLGIPAVPPEGWASDPDGIPIGGYGLALRPRDMAKLGLLYLNLGEWEGHPIVPAQWVTNSTRQHATKEDGSGYGYLWTVFPDEGSYAALGLGGQQIYVVPDLNLVVVLTGAVNDIGLDSPGYLTLRELLTGHILPAVKSAQPLPANPEGMAQLSECLRRAADPAEPLPPLPAIAGQISGKTYHIESNPLGMQSFSLVFNAGNPEAVATTNAAQQASIGLDNLFRVSDGGAGQQLALRGRWEGEDTFVIDQILLGTLSEQRYRLRFSGAHVTLTLEDTVLGGEPVVLQGQP